MKRYFLTSIMLIMFNACSNKKTNIVESKNKSTQVNSQKVLQNDLFRMKLMGHVKSLKENTYEAITQKGKIKKGPAASGAFDELDKLVLFNQHGNIKEKIFFDSSGNLTSKIKYDYDGKNRMIEEKYFSTDDKLLEKWEYEYDKTGQLKSKILYENNNENPVSKWEFKYDKNGNKTEETVYNSSGVLESKWVGRYDQNSRLIEEIWYDSEKTINSRNTYTYNKRGQKTQMIISGRDESIQEIHTFKYDKEGMLIEEEINNMLNENNKLVFTFTYQKDEKGNWVKKTIFQNHVPMFIISREFEYK